MRGLLLLLTSLIVFASCSTIEDNSPALQGVRDSLLFRTSDSRAVFNPDGSLVIRGERGIEAVNFLVVNQGQGQIALGGQNNPNVAAYTDANGDLFTTTSDEASGELNYTINSNNTVSGDFRFTAFRPSFLDTVVFSRGFIFQVPILSDVANEPMDEEAQDAFTARVNTIIFNPTIINRAVSGGALSVTGQTSSNSMVITFPVTTTPGTYELGTNPEFTAVYNTPSGAAAATSGQLNIVSNDQDANIVVAEFSFETAESFSITDGGFTINY